MAFCVCINNTNLKIITTTKQGKQKAIKSNCKTKLIKRKNLRKARAKGEFQK